MALDTCINCPPTCLNQEYSTDCGYIGKAISSKGILKGESLTSVLEKLAEETSQEIVAGETVTTDDITTNSLVRNPSALCASRITVRDFEYKLTTAISSSSLSWNVMNIVSNLPPGYEVGTMQVKAVGKNNGTGTTIFNTNKLSAAQTIDLNRYPVTVDLSLRIVTECGNVDMTKQIYLSAPVQSAASRVFMAVNDLMPGDIGDLKLTQQLDILEASTQFNAQRLNELEVVEISGITQDLKQVISSHDSAITNLQEVTEAPTFFAISYEKQGSNLVDGLGDIITEPYATIKTLEDSVAQHQADITTLRAQVDSLL